jgi:hypothetical protein
MNLLSRNRCVTLVLLALIGALPACTHDNDVTGPVATPTPMIPLSGSWVGEYGSSAIVLCVQEEPGTASASLSEAGASVTGTLTAQGGGCRLGVSLQLTRVGNQLNGTAKQEDFTGSVTGSITSSALQLTIGALENAQGVVIIGGSAALHRA